METLKWPDDYIGKVINADCLLAMKNIPDKSIDLVLTDPPYESEAHTLQRRVKRGNGVMKVEPLEFKPMTESIRIAVSKEIGRVAKKWVLTFCQIEASHIWRKSYETTGLVYKRTCIWVKPDGMPQYSGDRPGMGYETFICVHPIGRSKWNGGGRVGVFTYNKNETGSEKREHPTIKPMKLIGKLIDLFSNENEIILDPFLGSGTTAVACERLGRKWIGIEISEKYCEIARRRIEKERSQLKLEGVL